MKRGVFGPPFLHEAHWNSSPSGYLYIFEQFGLGLSPQGYLVKLEGTPGNPVRGSLDSTPQPYIIDEFGGPPSRPADQKLWLFAPYEYASFTCLTARSPAWEARYPPRSSDSK